MRILVGLWLAHFEHRRSLQMDPKNLQFSLFPGVGCSGGWSQSILLLCRIVPPTTLLKDKNNRRQCIVNQIFQIREDLFLILECLPFPSIRPSVRGKHRNQCLIEKKKISRLITRPWQVRTPISPIPVLFAPDTKVLNESNIPQISEFFMWIIFWTGFIFLALIFQQTEENLFCVQRAFEMNLSIWLNWFSSG